MSPLRSSDSTYFEPLQGTSAGGGRRRRDRPSKGVLNDVVELVSRYNKRTSAAHKRLVLVLIAAGVALRAWMLTAPITYEEAFLYVKFASQPLATVLGDYSFPVNQVFHTLLVKWSTSLFGTGSFTLRLPAFLAGVFVLPIFYLLVRAYFNRYIALMALALVAASGALVEYGSLATGYSISWLCIISALALGRHFARTNSRSSALLIGVVCALGIWSVPTTVHAVVMVYAWLLIYFQIRYKRSLGSRNFNLLLSSVLCIALVGLLYAPILSTYGLSQLFHHATLPQAHWKTFSNQHLEGSYDLWSYLTRTSSTGLAITGIVLVVYAAYESARYRLFLFTMALGAIPLVILRAYVAPPRDWLYILFFLHLGTAIGVFYALKAAQTHIWSRLGKRIRTTVAALVLLVAAGISTLTVVRGRLPRHPEALYLARYLAATAEPFQRILIDTPQDAPVQFHGMAQGLPAQLFEERPAAGAPILVLIDRGAGQTLTSVLRTFDLDENRLDDPSMVYDRGGMEIFAARLLPGSSNGATVGDAP